MTLYTPSLFTEWVFCTIMQSYPLTIPPQENTRFHLILNRLIRSTLQMQSRTDFWENILFKLVHWPSALILSKDTCTMWRRVLDVSLVHVFPVLLGVCVVSLLSFFEQPSNFCFSNSLVPPTVLTLVIKHLILSSFFFSHSFIFYTVSLCIQFSFFLLNFFLSIDAPNGTQSVQLAPISDLLTFRLPLS